METVHHFDGWVMKDPMASMLVTLFAVEKASCYSGTSSVEVFLVAINDLKPSTTAGVWKCYLLARDGDRH